MKTLKFLGLVVIAVAIIVIGLTVLPMNTLLVLPEAQRVAESA